METTQPAGGVPIEDGEELRFRITRRGVQGFIKTLIFFEIFLSAVYIVSVCLGKPFPKLHLLFNLGGETNISAWFSSAQLLLIGIVFLLMSRRSLPLKDIPPEFFAGFGLFFVFFSADENTMIHERLSSVLSTVHWFPQFRGGHGGWILIYVLVGAGFLLFFIRSCLSLWRHHRRETLFFLGGFVMLGIGILTEGLKYQFLSGQPGETMELVRHFQIMSEEFLEMSGMSLTLYGVCLLAFSTRPVDSGQEPPVI